jgi:hypothetical protein
MHIGPSKGVLRPGRIPGARSRSRISPTSLRNPLYKYVVFCAKCLLTAGGGETLCPAAATEERNGAEPRGDRFTTPWEERRCVCGGQRSQFPCCLEGVQLPLLCPTLRTPPALHRAVKSLIRQA